MMESFTIELTDDEKVLVDQIEFEGLALKDHIHAGRNGELVKQLTKMLIARGAIPEHRRKYFTDPAYHVGGRGSSRLALFEGNGCRGDDILVHPHFLRHLRYFLFGAELSRRVMSSFREAVRECGMVTSSDIVPLGLLARRLARGAGLAPRDAREEFFKLALDCGLSSSTATSIRESAGRK